MKWIKQHKRAVIFFIGILVITPISINICLYCNIPTHNTTASDWLGFWGSFLGSIIGGVATLWGVIITINQIESNEKVLIIPLQSDFDIEFDFDDKYSIKKHYL
ncbi:hypothetical protein [uncultured Clostridium sp.]|uniref:hypothetical protein n=1 Tax=uncultured Clostridium sp. TaxID=59620 RepID=UPI0025DE1EAF|nr:hypothetical protein [uncultured Clostridium sp.]